MHSQGFLSELQLRGQDLISSWPDFDPAILEQIESAACAGDSYAAAICAAAFRFEGRYQNCMRAFDYARAAASARFPPGLAELSFCYQYGCGTGVDLKKALELAEESAHSGYGTAACCLAIQFADGEPYGVDKSKAIEYAHIAEKSGEAFGAYLLGLWYEQGLIIDKNLLLARIWYKKAARQGSGLACVRMVAAYSRGELGLPKNTEMALEFERLIDKMDSA